jgi:hypothetical protein
VSYNHHHVEAQAAAYLDAWMPVPVADAREAARRFLTSGGHCPGNLTWHPEPAEASRPS